MARKTIFVSDFSSKEISDGHTRREAMRSLKRHLSRRLYRRLIEVPLTS